VIHDLVLVLASLSVRSASNSESILALSYELLQRQESSRFYETRRCPSSVVAAAMDMIGLFDMIVPLLTKYSNERES
jgi:hypothetical protein